MTYHEQVPIAGQDFTADVGIAPLIQALWNRGYQTTGSCEDQFREGFAWVGFPTLPEAERFAALIGGRLIIPTAQELANCDDPDDPALNGAVGVGFPSTQIRAALAAVEPLAALEALEG
jgi:hypothetical protein